MPLAPWGPLVGSRLGLAVSFLRWPWAVSREVWTKRGWMEWNLESPFGRNMLCCGFTGLVTRRGPRHTLDPSGPASSRAPSLGVSHPRGSGRLAPLHSLHPAPHPELSALRCVHRWPVACRVLCLRLTLPVLPPGMGASVRLQGLGSPIRTLVPGPRVQLLTQSCGWTLLTRPAPGQTATASSSTHQVADSDARSAGPGSEQWAGGRAGTCPGCTGHCWAVTSALLSPYRDQVSSETTHFKSL